MLPKPPGRLVQSTLALLIATFAVPVLLPAPVMAQTAAPETNEARLRRIEGELRALQRKVFPDGAGKTFAPQITPGEAVTPTVPAAGNTGALSDVLARLDAVEAQIKALTAASEENQNRLGKLETRVGAVETSQAALTAAATPTPPQDIVPPAPPAKPAKTGGKAPKAADPVPPAQTPEPSAARAAALAAIVRPDSGDKAEDLYTYGYRLWEAKFLPEAETALNDFIKQYPAHRRISYARNLLGRAYLDDNRIRSAAQWFLQNYLADKAGDRAADSLLYLGIAMTRDKETKRACDALAEFRQTYPTEAEGRLKGQFEAASKSVTCH